MATEQCESTVIRTPVTMTPGPPLTQSSIREMRESLPLSVVPSSLARYVTCEGDSSVQENDWLSIVSWLHSAQVGLSWSRTALVMFSGCSSDYRTPFSDIIVQYYKVPLTITSEHSKVPFSHRKITYTWQQ